MKFRDCNSMNPRKVVLQQKRTCKQELLTQTMYLPTCLWAQIGRTPFNSVNDRSSDASCKIWCPSISEIDSSVSSIRKKLSYRKDVYHNPSIKYALRCWAKRKWIHVLWNKPFPEVQTNRVESIKTGPWPNNEIHSSLSRTNLILPVNLFPPSIYGL